MRRNPLRQEDLTAYWQPGLGRNHQYLILADFNGDSIVDEYDAWICQQNLGATSATHAQGDADLDGDVDADDAAIAYLQFGTDLAWVE